MICIRALIFHMSISCDMTFLWVPKFLTLWLWPRCLTYLLTYSKHVFWLVGTRALTFHMSVPCNKTFSWVQKNLTLWLWLWYLTYLLKTLTLAISFKWYVCTRTLIFNTSVSSDQTFPWVPTDLTLWPRPWCLTYIIKTLTLPISFELYVLGLWYFTWVFVVTNPFSGCQQVWPCDLDLYVWLTEIFNLGCIFWMVCIRTLILHMSVPSDKALPWVSIDFTLWPWPWCFTYILKTLTLIIIF
jgi:hypothetical protein